MFNILELNLNSNLNSLILKTNLSCYVILVMEFLGCHRTRTVDSSDGALAFTQCINSSGHCTDTCYLGTVGSSDCVLSFLFLLRFWPLKNILSCHFGIMRPRNVYKDTLNNMISPFDHVVMNHQNHTRTNDIWGHVHYNVLHFYLGARGGGRRQTLGTHSQACRGRRGSPTCRVDRGDEETPECAHTHGAESRKRPGLSWGARVSKLSSDSSGGEAGARMTNSIVINITGLVKYCNLVGSKLLVILILFLDSFVCIWI
jgi:hypothetical protein